MRHTIKAILCLLALTLLLSFVACGRSEQTESTQATAQTTESESLPTTETTAPEPEAVPTLTLFEDGKTAFRIVRPDEASVIGQQAGVLLTRYMTERGIKVQLTTDWDTKRHDPESYEILIGNTAYTPEGAMDLDLTDLGSEGFLIEAVGNKLLLRAGNDAALLHAIEYFNEQFLCTEATTMTVPCDYRHISGNGLFLSEFTLAGTDISEFAIATEGGDFADAAAALATLIWDKCGVVPPSKGSHRILLTTNGASGTVAGASFEQGNLILRAPDAASMKKALLCFWMEVVYHQTGSLHLPADLAYSRDLAQTVFYSDYVTPAEGVCCLDRLIEAHRVANSKGYKVFADLFGEYYIASTGKTATVKTDVEWGNAHFIIDDSTIPVAERGNWIFTIASDHKAYAISNIKTLDRTQTNLDITLPQKSLVTFHDNTTMQYIRYGGNANNGSAKRDTVVVDRDGSIDPSAPLIWDFDKITSITVLPIDEAPRTVSGGSFTTIANRAPSEYTYYARGLNITRSNTTVKHVKHYVTGEGATGAPYSAFFQVANCAYVTVENCLLTGHKTYQSPTTKMGSYDINGSGAISLTFRNCTQTNDITDATYWGVLGSNFCKNLVYDGCILSRFDAHQGVANAAILNSTLGHMGANAIGFGTLRIENSRFYSSCVVNLRSDYGSTWEGDVIIRNCYFKPTKDSNCYLITGKNEGGHDFGYTCHMPRTVTIEGLHADTKVQMYVFANLNPNCTSEGYVPAYPHIVTESVNVSDFVSNGEQPLLISPNQTLFRTTEFHLK